MAGGGSTIEWRLKRRSSARLMDDIDDEASAILPFPLQNAMTRPARTAAAQQQRSEFLSLWAGQGLRLVRRLPAEELVRRLAEETAAALGDAEGAPG